MNATQDPRKQAVLVSVLILTPSEFQQGFYEWLKENWRIWVKFETWALEMVAKRQHYSAKTLFELIRHHTRITENDPKFKLNNIWTPDCARLFGLLHPAHRDFFSTRKRLAAQEIV
ncbi:MAG: hypothetical protein ACE15D_18925 [Candidatus Eisenbacteria bacterium]